MTNCFYTPLAVGEQQKLMEIYQAPGIGSCSYDPAQQEAGPAPGIEHNADIPSP